MKAETLTPGVEIVRGEEHGEEQNNPWILFEGDKETDEFSFPRWMAGSDHSRAISTDHLVWIGQENRKDDPG